MTKGNGLVRDVSPAHVRTVSPQEHAIIESVNLRVNTVDENEIQQLSTVVDALKNRQFNDDVVRYGDGNQDFVVTVKPATLTEIKEALHMMLKVVTGDRIMIET
ncbi:MAG: hypothetical protein ACE5G1_16535 [bacterium]